MTSCESRKVPFDVLRSSETNGRRDFYVHEDGFCEDVDVVGIMDIYRDGKVNSTESL